MKRVKKLIILRANGDVIELEQDHQPTLEELQCIVDGYISIIPDVRWENLPADMYVNEEGLLKLKKKLANIKATGIYHQSYSGTNFIVGDVVILIGWRLK